VQGVFDEDGEHVSDVDAATFVQQMRAARGGGIWNSETSQEMKEAMEQEKRDEEEEQVKKDEQSSGSKSKSDSPHSSPPAAPWSE
jgi:hypothetical protein